MSARQIVAISAGCSVNIAVFKVTNNDPKAMHEVAICKGCLLENIDGQRAVFLGTNLQVIIDHLSEHIEAGHLWDYGGQRNASIQKRVDEAVEALIAWQPLPEGTPRPQLVR